MIRLENGSEPLAGHGMKSGPVQDGLRETHRDAEVERKIEGTISYMVQHLDRPLQVSELAALANISSSHYFALFKRLTGFAPIDFFIRLRMGQACKFLDGTSLSVKEVAAKLGYDDPFYFSRLFKLVNHVPPQQYRLMSKRSKGAIKNAALPNNASSNVNGRHHGSATNGAHPTNGEPAVPLFENAGLPGQSPWNEKPLHQKHNIVHSLRECVLR